LQQPNAVPAARRVLHGPQMTLSLPDEREEDRRRGRFASPHWGRCHLCAGRLNVLVRIEPQTNGQPVTYYACEQCGHVLVRKA
jgi:hypothetical protein